VVATRHVVAGLWLRLRPVVRDRRELQRHMDETEAKGERNQRRSYGSLRWQRTTAGRLIPYLVDQSVWFGHKFHRLVFSTALLIERYNNSIAVIEN
jgi:hypothetical protein